MNQENKNNRHSRMSLSGISHILGGCYYSIKVVILDLIQNLQRLSLSFINNVRGRFQIKFGMTSLCNNRGFTLIELLVVVLIIGLLAAIAVPQYQKAVAKSRIMRGITYLSSLEKAVDLYVLANGWPEDDVWGDYQMQYLKDKLDISLPLKKNGCDSSGCEIESGESQYYTWLGVAGHSYIGSYLRFGRNARHGNAYCTLTSTKLANGKWKHSCEDYDMLCCSVIPNGWK